MSCLKQRAETCKLLTNTASGIPSERTLGVAHPLFAPLGGALFEILLPDSTTVSSPRTNTLKTASQIPKSPGGDLQSPPPPISIHHPSTTQKEQVSLFSTQAFR